MARYLNFLPSCRLFEDPKPLVVGIQWVVECAEKHARVDETPYLVDLEGVGVAGSNKVGL